MKFTIQKEIFFLFLKKNCNILTKNPNFPIVENILLIITKQGLSIISSNLDIEITTHIPEKFFKIQAYGKIIVSGKKILNICKNSPKNSEIQFFKLENKLHIKIQRSIFKLISLNDKNFPTFQITQSSITFEILQKKIKEIILMTQIAIANNDVRNYLNGMLLEKKKNILYAVATDGYRMAICKTQLTQETENFQIIINKKNVLELINLLIQNEKKVKIIIFKNFIKFDLKNISIISKLIEGNFPRYQELIIKKPIYKITINTKLLKESLLRVSILCNTTFKGVTFNFSYNKLKISSNNQEEEESEDSLNIEYFGNELEFSINVFYVLDVLNTIQTNFIDFILSDPIFSVQIQSQEKKETYHVIMPLKL